MSAIDALAAGAIDRATLWGACRMESADCEAFGVEAIADMLRRAPFPEQAASFSHGALEGRIADDQALLIERNGQVAVRIWRIGVQASGQGEKGVMVPFDTDLAQAQCDVFADIAEPGLRNCAVGLARTILAGLDAFRSRVRELPEFNGELPISTMADELETEGEGQVRALLITAHNPVLSAPNGRRLDRALSRLELMVAVDLYVNETTRHAHYILPSTTTLEHDHYDIALHAVGIRNTTRWNGALFEPAKGLLHDWQIFLRLIAEITGGVAGRAMLAVGNRITPRTIVDLLLRAGPTTFTVKKLEALPHGVDLGPLVPRLKELGTTVIELTPEVMLRDVARLRAAMSRRSAVSASDQS